MAEEELYGQMKIKRLVSGLYLVLLGIWLLCLIWFEDTSDWSRDRVILVKRTFATIMLVIVIASLICTLKALGEDDRDRRVDRIESRQDRVVEGMSEIRGRLAVVEASAIQSANHLDRLIWGVIALTIAVIGQLLLALLRFKLDRDDRAEAVRNRDQDRSDRGYLAKGAE